MEPEAEPMNNFEKSQQPPIKENKKIFGGHETKKEWNLAGNGLQILRTGMMKLLSLPQQVSFIFSQGYDMILNGGARKRSIRQMAQQSANSI